MCAGQGEAVRCACLVQVLLVAGETKRGQEEGVAKACPRHAAGWIQRDRLAKDQGKNAWLGQGTPGPQAAPMPDLARQRQALQGTARQRR